MHLLSAASMPGLRGPPPGQVAHRIPEAAQVSPQHVVSMQKNLVYAHRSMTINDRWLLIIFIALELQVWVRPKGGPPGSWHGALGPPQPKPNRFLGSLSAMGPGGSPRRTALETPVGFLSSSGPTSQDCTCSV